MKENILIALAVVILLGIGLQLVQKNNNRYEVVTSQNMLTILVDKQTGNTWRNCICGENSNVPGCWEKMITVNPESFNKPVGEIETSRKMRALQKKFAKQQSQKPSQVPAQK